MTKGGSLPACGGNEECEMRLQNASAFSFPVSSLPLCAICRSKGTPFPGSDLVIAACAFFHQAEIESSDRHFDILETYRPLP